MHLTILDIYQKFGVIIDPHTAVGMNVGLQCRKPKVPLIVDETAQPAKFEDAIKHSIGIKPPIPRSYQHLAELPERTVRIEPDAQVVKQFIANHA